MIVGIGNDVVNIARIEAVLHRHGARFLDRVYTSRERAMAERMKDGSGTLAKRWAAKEACSKALGTGMARSVAWRDIEVRSRRGRRPWLELHGAALRRLNSLVQEGRIPVIHLSMSDDRPCATAMVVIESAPGPGMGPQVAT